MVAFITLVIGFILGLLANMFAMKISFKQRTIDNKIKVYDSIITSWVRMRNEIFSQNTSQDKLFRLDQIYGESQGYIGEIFLVTESNDLAIAINEFNEKFFRQNGLGSDLTILNQTLAVFKDEALILVARMKNDIHQSTILTRDDFLHIISGIFASKKPV